MLFAYDYPLLGIFFSVMWFFLWVLWLMTLFYVLADIFRSRDLSGVSRAAWMAFVIFLPFLGVFAYLVARGNDMGERVAARRRGGYDEPLSYDEARAGSVNVADQIAQLGQLREDGALTDADYEAAKAKILA